MRHRVAALRLAFLFIWMSTSASPSQANEATSLPQAPRPSQAATARYGPGPAAFAGKAAPQQSALPPAVERHGASDHAFWDRKNAVLFTAVGLSRALDYSSTLNMRRRGRQELLLTNEVVDNHAAFAAIEAGGTAVSIGASYLFHRYHHHRLERWTSIVHASLATSGAIRNYALESAHPSTAP